MTDKHLETIAHLFTAIEDKTIMKKLLQDLLTPGEITEFAQRRDLAQKIDRGETYKQIEQDTGISSTTIARVAKCLHGTVGGYRAVIDEYTVKYD